ncbi:MFS transporter [Enterobacter sp. CC120223-11]|uniref:MFS transporter n=1 Tax=Enterobacter sp. CC120223-11 TaxID=1378073 RepID=UPI000BC8BFFF|nr:MFS transporter [Enterobacter sp. CC120223-11]SNY58635.1 MFS transporter, DHA2 family, multidrug resistance protein [Enterobacter sp. CC120223-11]
MTLFSDQPGDEGLPGRERAFAMAAVMTSTLMAVFDGSMVNIALPQMAQSLAVTSATAVWFANGYLLSAAMTLAIFAALATRFGFRAVFLFGLSLFTLASVGCAMAFSAEMLIAMRILQGIGGAATLSIAPAILRSVFPGRLLGRILGMNALLIASSTAVAPVLGGALLDTLSWPWLFAINILPGSVAIALAMKAIPHQPALKPQKFDATGAVLSATLLGSLIMAANSFAEPRAALHALNTGVYGWSTLALVGGITFIWHIRRTDKPLLPPVIFTSSRFSLAALTSLASFVSQGITFVALPFLFQSVYGYSALDSALLFTPWPVGIVLVAPHAGRLADKYPPSVISTLGLAVFVIGLTLLAMLPAQATAWDIGLRSLICGMGFGCFQSPNNREMLSGVAREFSGYASGVLAIVRTFGQCVGAALVGVMLAIMVTGGQVALEAQAVRMSLWVAVIASGVAVVFSLSRLRQN